MLAGFALLLALPAVQDAEPPTPAEIVLPEDREDRIASIERSMELGRFSPATRRVIAGMLADFSYVAERRRAERDRLMAAAAQAARRVPFDAEATIAALTAVDAFDRANSDDKPALTARILRAVPAAERQQVARHLVGGRGAYGDPADAMPEPDPQD